MSDTRSEVQDTFRLVFGDSSIVLRDSMTAEDIDGWDSTANIDLMIAIEKRFKIRFAAAEFASIKAQGQNVGTLIALIEKKRGAV